MFENIYENQEFIKSINEISKNNGFIEFMNYDCEGITYNGLILPIGYGDIIYVGESDMFDGLYEIVEFNDKNSTNLSLYQTNYIFDEFFESLDEILKEKNDRYSIFRKSIYDKLIFLKEKHNLNFEIDKFHHNKINISFKNNTISIEDLNSECSIVNFNGKNEFIHRGFLVMSIKHIIEFNI